MGDLLRGKAQIGHLQEVRFEELLGREAVRLDLERLRRELTGRRILVTGAAGSIGSELCRQLASFEPEMLVLLDRAESGLYFVDLELKRAYPSLKVVSVVGDILDCALVAEVAQTYAPELVYHAAAYKHVPLMEAYPLEGILNNVFGTAAVLDAALQNGVKKFVLISTDKAVKPVGVMGMTKCVAEDLVRMNSGGPTILAAVRFGNVVGSPAKYSFDINRPRMLHARMLRSPSLASRRCNAPPCIRTIRRSSPDKTDVSISSCFICIYFRLGSGNTLRVIPLLL